MVVQQFEQPIDPNTAKMQQEVLYKQFREMKADIFHPNYNNHEVLEIIAKLDPFDWNFNQEEEDDMFNMSRSYDENCEREMRQMMNLENRSIYQGEWNKRTNMKDGRGIQIWPDGSRYDGYWKNDVAQGHGRLIHVKGDVYEGQWKDDKADGFGIYTHSNGNRYVGDWKDDKQHGKGVEVWADDSKYDGFYQFGMKEGKGKFTWKDGSSYIGEFH